jgi:hypothetical protein
MTHIPALIALLIYIFLALICLVMAVKTFTSRQFLPFHEKAADTKWDNIDKPLQSVIITLVRISGLGFLTVFLFLVIFPLVNYLKPDSNLEYLIPVIPFVFCLGLFIFNYSLFRKSKADTPWKGALLSMILIIIAFCLSLL